MKQLSITEEERRKSDCPHETCDGSGWIFEDDREGQEFRTKCLCRVEKEGEEQGDAEREDEFDL